MRENKVDAIVSGNVTDAVFDAESVTWNVAFVADCEAVGVPVMTPVELLRLRVDGRWHVEGQDHVYGGAPPLAASWFE